MLMKEKRYGSQRDSFLELLRASNFAVHAMKTAVCENAYQKSKDSTVNVQALLRCKNEGKTFSTFVPPARDVQALLRSKCDFGRYESKRGAVNESAGIFATSIIEKDFNELAWASRTVAAFIRVKLAQASVKQVIQRSDEITAIARSNTECTLYVLNVLCATWCQQFIQHQHLVYTTNRVQNVLRGKKERRRLDEFVNAVKLVQDSLMEQKKAREEAKKKREQYEEDLKRLRKEQLAEQANDELSKLVKPTKPADFSPCGNILKCEICLRSFPSLDDRVCILLQFFHFLLLHVLLLFFF